MKLLVYGINFAPELTGIGKYTGEMVAWLAARGHEVRVVTAPPYYPDWSVRPGYSGSRYAREDWRGATVLRTPLWVPRKVTGLKRLVHLASFALSSLPTLLAQWGWKPDVVWVTEPPLFCAPAALAFARLRSAKAWLHIQDYEVDAAFELGLLKGAGVRSIVAAAERGLMRRFDRISTISSRMMERASSKGCEAARLVSLPNWADVSAVQPLQAASPYRAELGIAHDAVVALYSGNMGAKQGLEVLAEIAHLLQGRPDLAFVFCGNGAGRANLMQRCEKLANVRFLDLQPVERLGDLLGLADIHLLPQRADAADLVMPSKLTGMLSSGRPVVAGARPETELGRVASQCGIAVAPDDARAFADAVLTLASQPALRRELSLRARAFAEANFDRDAVLARFEQDLEACIGVPAMKRAGEARL
jgi:colanic acid biosynthesis glycosyl transferase WcaI